jgi:hypothetical protein
MAAVIGRACRGWAMAFARGFAQTRDPWMAFTGFVENLLVQLTADRGLLEAFTGDYPAAVRLAEACQRGMAHLSTVLDRARRAGTIRTDASDKDIVNLLWALSLLGENPGASAWQRPLQFITGMFVHTRSSEIASARAERNLAQLEVSLHLSSERL